MGNGLSRDLETKGGRTGVQVGNSRSEGRSLGGAEAAFRGEIEKRR